MEARQHEDLRDFVDSLEEEWLREVPDLHTAGLAVVARLVRMSYYIARRVDSNLARFGLTRGEFEVLAVLTRNPDAKITPKDIHAKILITSGGLSNRIRKLEEKGLIVRMPDQSDGRGVVLKVTEKGRHEPRRSGVPAGRGSQRPGPRGALGASQEAHPLAVARSQSARSELIERGSPERGAPSRRNPRKTFRPSGIFISLCRSDCSLRIRFATDRRAFRQGVRFFCVRGRGR